VRVLYGVAGEGMGHATRSAVVAAHLVGRGHVVRFVASGRAAAFLRRRGADVVEILGLELRYTDGAVDLGGAVLHNAARLPSVLARAGAAWSAADAFAPDLVVTDFDSFAQAYAATRGLPLLAIDNLQAIDRLAHDPAVLGPSAVDIGPARAFVQAKGLGAAHHVVTTFFYPPVRPEYAATTTLVPPIVRAEVAALGRPPPGGDHVLVYQTALGDTRLLATLASLPRERFVVYGLRRSGQPAPNVVLKDFDEAGFITDLARARAVIANGGMSLLGEAVCLGKPILSVPVRGHFEQGMNARYVAALGYGECHDAFDPGPLGAFLARTPAYASRLHAAPAQRGNAILEDALDRLVGPTRGA
jgi:uncharacterized protein (TIGR00661 family)